MALTNKQQAFINEYLQCWNATQAAISAGYSERTARAIGSENLTKPDIIEAIEARKAEMMMSADEALIHIAEIARGEFGPGFFFTERTITVLDKDRKAVEINDIGLDWEKVEKYGRLIKSISFTANGPKIELHDRLRSLEDIGKAHGVFTDKVDVTSGGNAIDEIIASALTKAYGNNSDQGTE